MNKNILWIVAVIIILMPMYFFIGIGGSPEAPKREMTVPYEIDVILDDSALDPGGDTYTAFNDLVGHSSN